MFLASVRQEAREWTLQWWRHETRLTWPDLTWPAPVIDNHHRTVMVSVSRSVVGGGGRAILVGWQAPESGEGIDYEVALQPRVREGGIDYEVT